MRRKITWILVLIMAFTCMVPACSSTPAASVPSEAGPAETGEAEETPADNSADTQGAADEIVNITFMEVLENQARTEWLDGVIADFESQHPNIKVNREAIPWEQAHDRLVTQVAAKAVPDVLETPANWLSEFAATGAYENLQPYFDTWEYNTEIADIALSLGKSYDDTLYELPYGLYLVVMMYRSDWLAENNIPVPTTIEEYYQAIADVTDTSQNRYGYAFRGGAGCWGLLSTLLLGEMGTGRYFEDDNATSIFRRPEAVTALENFGNLYFNGYAPQDALNWGYAETVDSFTSGVTGFLVQDTEVIGVCLDKLGEDKFNTAMAPAGSDGNTYLIAGHVGLSISSYSEHKDEAWELITYLMSPEVNAAWAETSWLVPSNKDALNDPTFAEGLMAPVGTALTDPNVVLYSHPDYLPEWGEFYEKFSVNELQAYLLEEQTAAETLSNIAGYLEEAQAKYLESK